jgi:hydrogenase expression/formation protein HypC
MCIAVPAKICSINGTNAEIEYCGIKKNIDITLLPDAKKGDYVIVHAGFAIQIIDKDEAAITLDELKDHV